MRSEIASAESFSSCNLESFLVSSTFPAHDVMIRSRSLLTPLAAGLLLTAVQLAMAVGLLAPEGPLSDRYQSLIQHDSYWFINIVDRGYQTIVPPIDHKVMEVSNVAFFPAYPAIAALFRYGLNIDAGAALLITAQLAAWGFWSYFFLFCKRWNVSPALQICAALLILAHPAAFFLVVGYSESLFLMALLGFIYWSTAEGRSAKILAAAHGIVMSATRIVGIVCTAFPVVRSLFQTRWRADLPVRAGIYFCAAVIYYLSVSGVACVSMESMLRYEFCVHALIVLALLNFLRQFRTPPMLVRAFGITAVALLSAAGLCVQGWYVWNFTRGNWVA